jgi:hypothetical protein
LRWQLPGGQPWWLCARWWDKVQFLDECVESKNRSFTERRMKPRHPDLL